MKSAVPEKYDGKRRETQAGELCSYEIPERVQLQNGDWTWRPLEWGKATEAEIKQIRQEKVDPFYPNRRLVVVWPLAHGRKSAGLSGTLEGWMRREERR